MALLIISCSITDYPKNRAISIYYLKITVGLEFGINLEFLMRVQSRCQQGLQSTEGLIEAGVAPRWLTPMVVGKRPQFLSTWGTT